MRPAGSLAAIACASAVLAARARSFIWSAAFCAASAVLPRNTAARGLSWSSTPNTMTEAVAPLALFWGPFIAFSLNQKRGRNGPLEVVRQILTDRRITLRRHHCCRLQFSLQTAHVSCSLIISQPKRECQVYNLRLEIYNLQASKRRYQYLRWLQLALFVDLRTEGNTITQIVQATIHILAPLPVIDAIAVANVEAVAGTIPPDCALDEPREHARVLRIEHGHVNLLGNHLQEVGASTRAVPPQAVRVLGAEATQDARPVQEIVH